MQHILKSPAKYVQGFGILKNLNQFLQGMGKNLLVVLSEAGTKRMETDLKTCFDNTDYTLHYEIFCGECSMLQVQRLTNAASENGCTAVIGIGGGKILDAAKSVSHFTGLPSVIIPTVASTDAPCSSISVLYKENGEFDHYLYLNSCPNLVLVDTAVIAKAPAKLLVAGMGDAMATWFEARACRASNSDNQVGGKPTQTATNLAAMCWQLLQRNGAMAKLAAEHQVCTEALETIVEVNTYLSSVGFESGGLAAAHAIQKGFTYIPELHSRYHGDKVAFCTLTQLVLENAQEDIQDVLKFCRSVGLPMCFADLGYTEINTDLLRLAAEKTFAPGNTIFNMPFEVNPDMVYAALIAADAVGASFSSRA